MPNFFYWFRCIIRYWNSQTILSLIKLCGLTLLLRKEVILDLSRSARTPRFSCVSANSECHTISRVYPSETVRAHPARTYHRGLERAWQFDITWWSPFQQNYEELLQTFWCKYGDCSWLVGWQKKESQACVAYLPSLGYHIQQMISNNLSRALPCLCLSGHNFLVQRMRHKRNRRPMSSGSVTCYAQSK